MFVKFKFPADKVVIVALVIVALVPIELIKFEVEAFVVEALTAREFIELVAFNVPTLIKPAVRIEIKAESELNTLENKLVEVEFVIVPLAEFILFKLKLLAFKFVIVAFV